MVALAMPTKLLGLVAVLLVGPYVVRQAIGTAAIIGGVSMLRHWEPRLTRHALHATPYTSAESTLLWKELARLCSHLRLPPARAIYTSAR